MGTFWVIVVLTLWKHTPPSYAIDSIWDQKEVNGVYQDVIRQTKTYKSKQDCTNELLRKLQQYGGKLVLNDVDSLELTTVFDLKEERSFCHPMKVDHQ
tara:strand:+ start:71 stop:364 length:294 start_codon:yes stop_codon:yes gene_type:complete